jgi:hypothetical protein
LTATLEAVGGGKAESREGRRRFEVIVRPIDALKLMVGATYFNRRQLETKIILKISSFVKCYFCVLSSFYLTKINNDFYPLIKKLL